MTPAPPCNSEPGGGTKVDPNRIGCMGDSAGAHLAALVALAGDSPPFADAYPHDPYASVRTHVKVVVGSTAPMICWPNGIMTN